MKKTGTLRVIADIRMPFNGIVVNPNDGYDLDILTKEALVKIHACVAPEDFSKGDGFYTEGSLQQKNECKLGTVEMSSKTHAQIGKPANISLLLDGNKLLIVEQ